MIYQSMTVNSMPKTAGAGWVLHILQMVMGSYSDPHLKAAGWDAATKDHRLDGLACSYIRLEWSIGDDAPFTGVPDLNAVIRGRKVKNLETGVTEYSVNPAYCTLDYLTNPIFGKNLSASEYDLDSFKTAGLVAKTQVPEYQGAPTTTTVIYL